MIRAVETLLITDVTIRTASIEQRKELEELMREVEGKKGKVMVISASHEAGEKLLSIGGIAALLRFPVT
jgi:protein pelota